VKVIILRGISGAGKSTYCATLKGRVEVVSANKYFISADDKVYRFDPSRLNEAHAYCMREYLFYCSGGAEGEEIDYLVVDNTNSTPTEIAPYILVAAAYNLKVEVVQINCDPEVAFSRCIHAVPKRTILNQLRNIERKPLPPYWAFRMIP
jgi:predicted kinase